MSILKAWNELSPKDWQELEVYNAHLAPHIRYWNMGELLTEKYIADETAPPFRKYFIQSTQCVVFDRRYESASLKTTFEAFKCYVKKGEAFRRTILRDYNSLESLYAALLEYDKNQTNNPTNETTWC